MVPLVIASGAGAAGRKAVGTGVMGGMILATAIGIFFIPVFYVSAVKWLTRKKGQPETTPPSTIATTQEDAHA